MSAPWLVVGMAAWTLLPAAPPDGEETQRVQAEFVRLRENAIELLRDRDPALPAERREALETDEKARRQTRELGYVRVPALDPEGSAAAVDVASLGLSTSVEGAEAGLAVSPAALLGSTNPHAVAFNVFVGALKNDETRLGARWAWERAGGPGPAGLPTCTFDEAQARTWLHSIANEYRDGCGLVWAAKARPDGLKEAAWAVARAACGVPGAAYPKAGDANLDVALKLLADTALALRGSSDEETARKARALESAAKEIGTFDPTKFLDCYGAEKDLAERFRIEQWRAGSRKLGVSAHADFFPRRFGFSPDGKPLARGQVKTWQGRVDYSRQQGRGQWALGSGFGATRQDFTGDFAFAVTPAASASYMAFSLTGRSLLEEKEIEEKGRRIKARVVRVEDGKIVPHVVIGFLVKADVAPKPPSTQQTHFNGFEAQAFIDFKIRENLSFRLGVPVRAELKTRAANDKAVPPVTKLGRLQWTVPVAIVAVIKP